MSQRHESRSKSFPATVPLAAKRLVKLLATGNVVVAGAEDEDVIGVTTRALFQAEIDRGEWTPIDLINCEGTVIVEAAGEIAVADQCFQAANGTVDDTGTIVRGIAMSAAGAAGDWIEMLPTKQGPTGPEGGSA